MTIGKAWYHVEKRYADWNWQVVSRHRSLSKARVVLAKWKAFNGSAGIRYRIVVEQEIR